MRNPALLGAVGAVVLLALAWWLSAVAERRRRGMQGRLAAVVTAPSERTAAAEAAGALRRPLAGRSDQRHPLLPSRAYSWLLAELAATGNGLTVSGLIVAGFIGAFFAAGMLIGILGISPLAAAGLALVAGLFSALARLRMAQRRFQRRFVEVFPDALDVIARAARAGLPVLDAMEAAAETVAAPVAPEFRKTLDQMRIGVDIEESLEVAADRIRVTDFRFFAAAIVLQRRTGGSLAETLGNLSGLIRKRKEIRLKVRALSAETRLTAYLLGALPIIMIGAVYLINPVLMKLLFTDPRGQTVLAIAIAMEVIGYLMMTMMIKRALR